MFFLASCEQGARPCQSTVHTEITVKSPSTTTANIKHTHKRTDAVARGAHDERAALAVGRAAAPAGAVARAAARLVDGDRRLQGECSVVFVAVRRCVGVLLRGGGAGGRAHAAASRLSVAPAWFDTHARTHLAALHFDVARLLVLRHGLLEKNVVVVSGVSFCVCTGNETKRVAAAPAERRRRQHAKHTLPGRPAAGA